ncbi:hypothetical protein [Enterococcus casseliflavus]|uniref:hypothetical protein n=1 Tax=Enterococcus casseliflavus TaxID=37734 RepID=UPI00301A14A0
MKKILLSLFMISSMALCFYALLNGRFFSFVASLIIVILMIEIIQSAIDRSNKKALEERTEMRKRSKEKRERKLRVGSKLYERKKIIAIDHKYGRVPEPIFQVTQVLNGYYSLDEWKRVDPESYSRLSEEEILNYKKALSEIDFES